MDISRKHRSDCEHVNVIHTLGRVLSPDDRRFGAVGSSPDFSRVFFTA